MIGPAAVFLPFSFLLLYTSPGGWRGRAKPISSTRHPGRSGVTFHLISNNVITSNFSFHSLDWTNVKKKCAVPVSCGPHGHVFIDVFSCACAHTHTHHKPCTQPHTRTQTLTHTHHTPCTQPHTRTHTCLHTHTHLHNTHTHSHTLIHTHRHHTPCTQPHTRTHTHSRTHIYTHMQQTPST